MERDLILVVFIFFERVAEYRKLASQIRLSELITAFGTPLRPLKDHYRLFSFREKKPNTTPNLKVNARTQYEYIFEHLINSPTNAQIMELGESLVFGNKIS